MSKGLKALNIIRNYDVITNYEKDETKKIEELLPNSIHTIEKSLKALEIIEREFKINEQDFYYDEETNKYFFIGYEIKKEEYYLLKEVLL